MDILLSEFIKEERWQKAIESGVDKGIDKKVLRQLCLADNRLKLMAYIQAGAYEIAPPHIAQIPKDTPGEFRTVYINEDIDRVILSIINDMLFDMCKGWIHPNCKSYQKGIGCAKIVTEITNKIVENPNEIVGFKNDLSKYFDNVAIQFIDAVFDKLEMKFGKSAIIDLLRKYYHQDIYFELDGSMAMKYQSLKQGCATASWLADVLLYSMDEEMSSLGGYYVRYSDDILYLGENYLEAKEVMTRHLYSMGLTSNPKKFQLLSKNEWFKFLGYNLRGNQRTLSAGRVKKFQKEIEARTIKDRHAGISKAVNQVNRYLYKGNYPWATAVLATINVQKDIDTLNEFVLDCIRACATKKTKVGGLGVEITHDDYTILRGVGRNVKANRAKTPKEIDGYKSLNCMRNNLLICRPVYETIVRQM